MSTVAEPVTEVTMPMNAVGKWLNSNQTSRRVERLTQEALAALDAYLSADKSLVVPRQEWERKDGFSAWISGYDTRSLSPYLRRVRHQIVSELSSAFREYLSGMGNVTDGFGAWYEPEGLEKAVRTLVGHWVWPPIESRLRQYAITYLKKYAVRGMALSWLGGYIGDGLGAGMPEKADFGWRVPVVRWGTGERAGMLPVDEQGEILISPAAFRAALKRK